jgi:predicted ATPase/DNA-binding winged helix-turn-helix (wHTH) protein
LESHPQRYQFGEFTLDTGVGCVFKGQQEVKLRPKVYEALKYFVEHPGKLVGKQELMQAVWPDSFVTDDSLVQCTLELRRALDDRGQKFLKTVPRRGYIFTADVQRQSTSVGTFAVTDTFDLPDRRRLPSAKRPRKPQELPVPRTSLIGREQEVANATKLLVRSDVRLLTLTGPGGAGKTRLALAVAAGVADQFPAGVQFVSLASITHPELVSIAIANALDIQQVANRSISQLIADQLQNSGPFLLVLDNFEQVLSAATVIAETLEACPSLKVLVTSRSCLRIYGEQEFPVTPLARHDAIELFAHRAAAVWPGFQITAENTSAVNEICLRLDRLPLAIELAAARTKVLSPAAILDRLQNRLHLLTGGALDLPERQQTLRNTIDWSYGLLNEAEQRLFRRFSVFSGSGTLEAAEAVCNTRRDLGLDLFQGLSSLVDQNLIQQLDRSHEEPRFAMLETIREYAVERLSESGEQAATRRAHAAFCLVLAEEGNPELSSADRSLWLSQCDAEIDNFRSALDWLFQTQDLDWALRLCVALFRFWDMREHLAEGRARLETVLQLAGNEHTKERARILVFLGALASAQGDYAAARVFLEQSLQLYEAIGDESGIGAALNALAVSARDRGDYAIAQVYFERSLACWRTLRDRLAVARCLHNLANVAKVRADYPRARWALDEALAIFERLGDRSGAAWSINQQGDIARASGDNAAARALYDRALIAFQEAGDRWGMARSLTDLAYIDCEQGQHNAARAALRQALGIFAQLGHRRGIARALEGCACLALRQAQAARALTLAGAAAYLRKLISAPLTQEEQSKLDDTLSPAWDALTESAARAAWAEGLEMSMQRAVEFSFEETTSTTAD